MSNQDSKLSRVARRKQDDQGGKRSQHSKNGMKKKPKSIKRIIGRILLALLGLFIIGVSAGAILFFSYAKSAPTLSKSALTSTSSTTIYDSSGNKILTLGTEKRQNASQSQIPQKLKDAIVSIEDRRFYKHNGVDPYRIVSAAISDLTGSSSGLQGGSTLDQQLIKLAYFSTKKSDQTLKRKAQEAWLAIQMDKKYSKSQILTFYINKVFMGNGIYGMQTAAEYYYGKKLSQLTLAQTALIAGIPNAPSSYNPYSSTKLATQRRNEVLDAMVANKKITSAQAAAAKKVSVTDGLVSQSSHSSTSKTKQATWSDAYLKQVIKQVESKGYNPYSSSLKVYTNLNMKIQKKLYKLANSNTLSYPDNKVQVAATVVNPNNGKVLAMLGGRKTGNVTYGLNRAVQTSRTNGSTAKPLMDYAPAIEYLSWATYHQLDDTAYNYPGTSTALNDFDDSYKGTMTMQEALTESRNIPAIRALAAVGLTKAQNFISKLGFKYSKSLSYSNGIGLPSSTLQNAAAYSAFDNGGTYYKPTYINKIKVADGEVKHYSSKGKQVMQSSTAYMITYMLQNVISSSSGTGHRAYISGFYQAGKTGTNAYPSNISTNFPDDATMDSWFNGYTKHYSVSIWMGYDHPYKDSNYLSSSSSHLPQYFYKYLIQAISKNKSNKNWKRPSNVYVKTIDGVKYLYLAGTSDTYSDSSSSSSETSSSDSSSSSVDTSSISSMTTTSSVLNSISSESSDTSSGSASDSTNADSSASINSNPSTSSTSSSSSDNSNSTSN